MRFVKGAIDVAVTLTVLAAVTAILCYMRLAGLELHHPVFFYLLPIALLAIAYGSSLLAMLCAAGSVLCSAYFLYDPVYSFHVANTLEYGDLICFAVLALIGIKCAVELSRPAAKIPATRSRYGRP